MDCELFVVRETMYQKFAKHCGSSKWLGATTTQATTRALLTETLQFCFHHD